MKHIFNLDNLLITVLVFLVMAGLFFIPSNFDFLNPLSQALNDFELTDVVFSQLHDEASIPADTSIILVNIGRLKRNEIAEQIRIITAWHPKVLGVDAFFRKPKSPELDSPLVAALQSVPHLVMVSKVDSLNEEKDRFDTLETSHPMFMNHASTGFSNLITDDEQSFRTVRFFSPQEQYKDTVEPAFAVRVVQLYRPAAAQHLLARDKPVEIVNFRGNTNKFYTLDIADLANPHADLHFMKDKIVLMGYMGDDLTTPSLEDVFFTPLNKRYAGKTFPDMYGVVIHANIISMILHGDYVNKMPVWLNWIMSLALCYLNVAALSYILKYHDRWFGGETQVFQVLESIGLMFLVVLIFFYFKYKLEWTLAMVAIVASSPVADIYYSLIKDRLFRSKAEADDKDTVPAEQESNIPEKEEL